MRASCSIPAVSVSRIVASMALFVSVAGCGYKGALYMPPPPPAPEATLTQPPPAPPAMSEGAVIPR